jgi:hypothetical protein
MGKWTAQWARERRATLVVTNGIDEHSYQIEPPGEPPSSEMLWRNGWTAYPGSEWEEGEEGHWSRSVYPEPEARTSPRA